MDRRLAKQAVAGKIASAVLLAGMLFVASLLIVRSIAAATSYSGTSTGYAFGDWTGGANVAMYQGYFANHLSTYCPNDPAASWSYGTQITGVSPNVGMYDSNGYSVVWTDFFLEDIGDFACNKGNYWADWYFGRWKHSYDSCSCNNGVEHCYTGSTNNCTTATNWGNTSVSYNK